MTAGLKRSLLIIKLLSVLAYLGAMVALVIATFDNKVLPAMGISQLILLGNLAFLAFRFWRNSGRPLELDQAAVILTTDLLALIIMVGVAVYGVTEYKVYIALLSEFTLFALIVSNLLATHVIKSDKLGSININYLVLRSFTFDVVEFRDQTFVARLQRWLWRTLMWVPFVGDHAILALSAYQFGFTFESLLRESLSTDSRVAATVHNPAWKTIPPVIGTILKVRRTEDWTVVVRAALSVSSVVVALPGSSSGLRTEIEMIKSGCVSFDKLLIALPQSLNPESVDAFSSLLIGVGFDLSQVTLRAGGLYAFSINWAAIEVASGIETAEEAAKEIRAWTHYRSRPAPQWCELDGSLVEPTALGRCPSCGLILDSTRVESVWPEMGFRGRIWSVKSYDMLVEMEAS